ncbi:hypothetical protein RRG08_049496 [Elysia crispata]|uniref:Receptor ligand binding region domain-containing protein n=1 Tax=Elysia crispata TaxID=231223 RepID=A0AAE1DFV3_9GAST|nr:hypothetical protein RRG08_049496 [Elysia crispata]
MSTPVPYTLTSVNKMGKHETSRDILSTSSTTRSTRDMLPTSSTTRSTRDMLSTSSTTRSTRDMLPTSSTTRSTRDMLSTSSTTRSTRDMLPTSSTTRSTPPAQDVCTRPRPSRRREDIIQIGVILPLADHHLWSLKMALPAITLAVEEVNNNTSLLQGLSLVINARDSECSETIGPLAAFDMYVNQSADVFLGPACDYSVAPVARFSKFWGIPVLSAGALVAAFKDKTEYRLLTRVQGTHAKVGQFVLHLLKAFYWSHAAILYDDVTRSPNAEKRRCYFTAEGIFHALFQHFGWRPYNKRFDERSPRVDYVELLRGSSSRARGKQVELVLHSTSQARVVCLDSPRVDYVQLLRGSSSRARGKQVELVLHSTSQAGVGLFG